MIKKVLLAVVAVLGFSGAASAQSITACTCGSNGSLMTESAFRTALSAKPMMCAPTSDGSWGGWAWQEKHVGVSATVSTGDLTEKGTEKVGRWTLATANGRAMLTHTYDGAGGSYPYAVESKGGDNYCMCGAKNVSVTLKSGGC